MYSLNLFDFPCEVIGADRGFNVGSDILTHTSDGVPLATIYDEFAAALSIWNEARDAIAALFTAKTTDAFRMLPKDPDSVPDFEDSSEFGVPQAIRGDIEYLRMGFPLVWKDIATRFTEKFLRDAPADEIRHQFNTVLSMDRRLVFLTTMRALTNKRMAGSRDANENGTEVFDLWDGSAGEVPPTHLGKTFSSSHSHYLVSGAATLDSKDIEDLIDTIQEHGYGLPSNGERIILLAHPNTADAIVTWRAGVANANGATAKYDFIPSASAPAFLTSETVVGEKPPSEYNGIDITGSYGDAWVHKDYQIPAGYVIAVSTAGNNAFRNPLAFREHVRPEWRGLIQKTVDNHPLRNSYFQRGLGVGVRHRSAAAVLQIKASGNYDNPTWP